MGWVHMRTRRACDGSACSKMTHVSHMRDTYVTRETQTHKPHVRDTYVTRETQTHTPHVRDTYVTCAR